MTAQQPADAAQRKDALDIQRSFCVSAPAGSGKTELLTQRILKLLAVSDKPEEVLAITFTRKAASEMRARIVKALLDAWRNEGEVAGHQQQTRDLALQVLAQDKEKHWQLLHNPSRLRIQTIDGLCGSLARQLPLMTQFGTSPTITDDHQPLYQCAIARLLKQQGDADDDVGEAIGRLLWHLDNKIDKFYLLLEGLLAKRDQWLGLVGAKLSGTIDVDSLNEFLQHWVAEQLAELSTLLQPYGSTLAVLADSAATNLVAEHIDNKIADLAGIEALPSCSIEAVAAWQGLAELLLTNGQWRKSMTKKQGFPAKDKNLSAEDNLQRAERKAQMIALLDDLRQREDIRSLLAGVGFLPQHSYSQQQWQILQAISVTLWQLNGHLQVVFSERGEVDYTAISMAALAALGSEDEPTELALMWDYTTRHILVDEFQDTANGQHALLVKLINGWYEDNEANPQRSKTLFLVGDGMQSIYAFREANVGLFLQAREKGIGDLALTPLNLTVNFRSSGGIVEWNNRVFASSFPAHSDTGRGAVCYSKAVAFSQHFDAQAGQFIGCVDQQDRLLEAQKVTQLCSEALAKSTPQQNHSVAILVRNRSHLNAIIPALQQADVPWVATDIHGLASQMSVQDVLTLTMAMFDISDRVSWLALLRSPLIGLSLAQLDELSAIYQGNGCSIFAAYQEYAKDHDSLRIRTTANHLSSAWDRRLRKPVRVWLQGLWIALGGIETLPDSENYRHVMRYFELIEQLGASHAGVDIDRLQLYVDKLYAEPLATSVGAVQMMTIHKSKGLEFDTVIVPALDKQPRHDDKPLFNWQQRLLKNGRQGILVAPLAADGDAEDAIFALLQQENKLKLGFEKTRLLYVATTRAVEQLYLLANINTDDKKGGYKTPSSASLLASVWAAVKDDVIALATPIILSTEAQPQADDYRGIARLPQDWQVEEIAASPLLAAYRRDAMRGKQQNIPAFNTNAAARHGGTVVHEYLQVISEQGVEYWNADTVKDRARAIRLRLKELGVSVAELSATQRQVSHLLTRLLTSKTALWLLDNSHKDSECEARLGYWRQGGQQQYIIDRTFIDENNHRWIVDYKSASPLAEQSVDEFIAQQKEIYRQQLANYRRCYQAMETRTTHCALYFPAIDELVEV